MAFASQQKRSLLESHLIRNSQTSAYQQTKISTSATLNPTALEDTSNIKGSTRLKGFTHITGQNTSHKPNAILTGAAQSLIQPPNFRNVDLCDRSGGIFLAFI